MVPAKPCGPTTDPMSVKSGPIAVPCPSTRWQVAHAVPLGECKNNSRPRVACAVMGGFGLAVDFVCAKHGCSATASVILKKKTLFIGHLTSERTCRRRNLRFPTRHGSRLASPQAPGRHDQSPVADSAQVAPSILQQCTARAKPKLRESTCLRSPDRGFCGKSLNQHPRACAF